MIGVFDDHQKAAPQGTRHVEGIRHFDAKRKVLCLSLRSENYIGSVAEQCTLGVLGSGSVTRKEFIYGNLAAGKSR